jgi:hypothetical protein
VLGSAVALIAVGLLRLARIYRVTWLLLAWTALLVATHVGSNIKYGNYYAGVKFLSHTYFLLVLAAAATLLTTSVRWQRIGLAGLVMWLLAAGFSSERLLRHIRHNGYSISFAQTGESIQTIAGEQNVAVLSEARHPLHLVNLVAGQRGLKVAAIAPDQRDAINLIKLCQVMDCTQVAADGVIFDGVIVTDRTVFQDGQCFLGQSLLLLSPRRVLGQAGQLVFCEGRIELATAASFPRYHWVWEGCSRTPTLYAHSRHLRLAGEVSEFHPLPYRFTCNVPEMNWSRDVVVDKKGEFDVVLEMPEAIIGQTISVEFKNYGTFRPAERNPNSPDARELGFMLLGAGFEKQHR